MKLGGSGGLVAELCLTLATLLTVAHHVPLSMGFSRQKYWSGLLFPSPGDLSKPEIEPRPPALQVDLYRLSHQGSPIMKLTAFKTDLSQYPLLLKYK